MAWAVDMCIERASISGRLAEWHHVNFTLLSFPAVSYLSFHYDFEDFVEFVGGEAFDVIGASIEVTSNVCEDCDVGVDRGSIPFEDFKVCVAGR